tara:strand:+ start:713 stop:913 length:201 start_codon:yes stop_codon:yes gene_type:complete
MITSSKEHLNKANESYIQHFKAAIKVGFIMILGGMQAVLHAIIPGILTKSASEKIKKLYKYVSGRS